MPAQSSKATGSVLSRIKNVVNAAASKHAADDVDYGFQSLPGGIKFGIARLTECGFAEIQTGDNKGKPCFKAAGVVVEPKEVEVNGQTIKVEGMRTSIVVPICDGGTGDKKRSVEDQVAAVQNELKKLGVDDPSTMEDADGLESSAALLVELAPFFKFGTRESGETYYPQGHPQAGQVQYKSRVWESWNGTRGLEDYTPPEDSGVQDNTTSASPPAPPPPKPQPKAASQPPNNKPPVRTAAKTPDPEPVEGEGEGEYRDDADLDSLAARADVKGAPPDAVEARNRLGELARKAGVADDVADNTNTWAELVEMIKGTSTESSGDEGAAGGGADELPAEPEAGQAGWYYQVKGKDGKPVLDAKKKPKPPTEVEVVAVSSKKRTVDVKCLTTKQLFKGVPFDELTQEQ